MAISVAQNYTHHYTYDELGNMISNAWWTNHYAQSNNRLLKHDRQTLDQYTYDEHGNITSMPHLTDMVWNENDELIGATNENSFISLYNYDAGGNRTRKITIREGGILETRYYIGQYELFKKENSTDDYQRSTLNIADEEKVFARIESKDEEDPVIRYQYDNHLGSACLELSDSGNIISYEEYYPFGQTSYYTSSTNIEISLKRYKYCGKERDEETGLYYYGMRYYADWLCRFVSVDPLQFEYPELTPYQYASNNPVTMIDLDGLEGVDPQEQNNTQLFKKTSYTTTNSGNIDNSTPFKFLSNVGTAVFNGITDLANFTISLPSSIVNTVESNMESIWTKGLSSWAKDVKDFWVSDFKAFANKTLNFANRPSDQILNDVFNFASTSKGFEVSVNVAFSATMGSAFMKSLSGSGSTSSSFR